jgi:hypothetical protein
VLDWLREVVWLNPPRALLPDINGKLDVERPEGVALRARRHPALDRKENGDGRALAAGRGAEARRVVARAHRS